MNEFSAKSSVLSISLLLVGAVLFARGLLSGYEIELSPVFDLSLVGLGIFLSVGTLVGYAFYLSSRSLGIGQLLTRSGRVLGAIIVVSTVALVSPVVPLIAIQWVALISALLLPFALRPAVAIGSALSISAFGVTVAALHQGADDPLLLAGTTVVGSAVLLFYSVQRTQIHLSEGESRQTSKLVLPMAVMVTLITSAWIIQLFLGDGETLFPAIAAILGGIGIILSRYFPGREDQLTAVSRIVISSTLGLVFLSSLVGLVVNEAIQSFRGFDPFAMSPFDEFAPPTDPTFFQETGPDGNVLYMYERDFRTTGPPGLALTAVSGDSELWSSPVGISDDSTLTAGPIVVRLDGSILLTGGIKTDDGVGVFTAKFNQTGSQTSFNPHLLEEFDYVRPLELYGGQGDGSYLVILTARTPDDPKLITVLRLDESGKKDWVRETSYPLANLGYFEPMSGHSPLPGGIDDKGNLALYISGEYSGHLVRMNSKGEILLDREILEGPGFARHSHIDESGRLTILTEEYDPGLAPWSMGEEQYKLRHFDDKGSTQWVLSLKVRGDYLSGVAFVANRADLYVLTSVESWAGYEPKVGCTLTKISYGELVWEKGFLAGSNYYGPMSQPTVEVESANVSATCGQVKAVYSVDGALIDTEEVEIPLPDGFHVEPPF